MSSPDFAVTGSAVILKDWFDVCFEVNLSESRSWNCEASDCDEQSELETMTHDDLSDT